MNVRLRFLAAVIAAGVVATPIVAAAQEIHAKLDGYQVDSAQNTSGHGSFIAKIDHANKTIMYTLSYADLRGDIIVSHIHFSRPGTNGGIVLFLCGGAPPSPATTTPCGGARSGTVQRTVHAGDIVYVPFPRGGQFPENVQVDVTHGTGTDADVATATIVPGSQGFDAAVQDPPSATADPDRAFKDLVAAIEHGAGYVVVHTRFQSAGELRGNIPGRRDADDADDAHDH